MTMLRPAAVAGQFFETGAMQMDPCFECAKDTGQSKLPIRIMIAVDLALRISTIVNHTVEASRFELLNIVSILISGVVAYLKLPVAGQAGTASS